VVGAPKCGTTAVTRYLEAHPGCFMARRKDLHHFGADLAFRSPDGSSCSYDYAYSYSLNGSVGPDGNIHIVMATYSYCGNGYFPTYIKFNPSGQGRTGTPNARGAYSEAVFVQSPQNTGPWIQTTPMVTVDVNNVPFVVWSERSSRKIIYVARKNLGQTFFTAREQLVRANNSSDPKVLCSKYWPSFMRGVDGNNLHIIAVFGSNQLQYISTGAPLDAPSPSSPRNSAYVGTAQPTLAWQRLRTDNASGNTTSLTSGLPRRETCTNAEAGLPSPFAVRALRRSVVLQMPITGLSVASSGSGWRSSSAHVLQ
jgi:hypothetical protein